MWDIVTVLESKKGWIYPCEKEHINYSRPSYNHLWIFTDIWKSKKCIKRYRPRCGCGKDCKPITVTVKIEGRG